MSRAPQPHSKTSRLFLALWPETSVQDALRHWRDGWTWPPSASLVRPESLHLTLHFLGGVRSSRLPELMQGLKVPFLPFDLSFSGSQLWPNGVAVLEPDAVPLRLLQLHASLGAALQRLALPTEARAFHPHITLARHADGAASPAQGRLIRWRVHGYALIESRPMPAGEYSVVQRYAL